MKMMIVTGGTGGHIYPALALADAAKERYGKKADIVFVGNDDRMEASLIPEKGYRFLSLRQSGDADDACLSEGTGLYPFISP